MQLASVDHRERIGIIGAGCAGLTAAEELRSLGYRAVTLVEAKPRVGGKTFSFSYRDAPRQPPMTIEGGTVWFIPGPLYHRYVRRYGISQRYQVMPPAKLYDLTSGRATSPFLSPSSVSAADRAGQLVRFLGVVRCHGRPDDPGFRAPHYRDLGMSSSAWFAQQGLGFAREAFVPIANAAQFGPIERETPVAYMLKFLAVLNRFTLPQQLTLALPKFREGNQELWRRIAATHDVRLGTPVRRIERGTTIRVTTDSETLEFDRLIWAAPTDEFMRVADVTAEERAIFARARTITRAVVTCRVDGLPRDLFYFVKNTLDNGVPCSYPHVVFEVAPGSGVYNFYPFVDAHTTVETMMDHVHDLVERLGGRNVRLLQPPLYWTWFPHFSGEDIAAGIYERCEQLQGQFGTYFASELLAGVSVTYGMEYAADLVHRHFAPGVRVSDADRVAATT